MHERFESWGIFYDDVNVETISEHIAGGSKPG
jgi:hypothetical protein